MKTPAPSYELDWNYRRKYILEHVLKDGGLRQVEHQGDFVFLHYLSEQYGASQARITQPQYVELRYDEGWTEAVLDSVEHVVTEPSVMRKPNFHAELTAAIKNMASELNVTIVTPTSPVNEFAKDPPPHVPGEPFIVDHIGLVQAEGVLNEENAYFSKQVEVLAASEGVDIKINVKPSKYDGTGQLTAEAQAERDTKRATRLAEREQRKQEAIAARELKRNPPLPKLPVLEKREPLVLPTIGQLMDFNSTLTPEYFFVSKAANSKYEWYVAENSNGGGAKTLWTAIVNQTYVDSRYFLLPEQLSWNSISTNVRTNDASNVWKAIKPEVVLSTATGWFMGRLLGVVLTHRNEGEIPTSEGIIEFLNGELDSQFTPEAVFDIISRLWPTTHRNIRDRFELHVRLLRQLLQVQREKTPAPYQGTVNSQRDIINQKIMLIDSCKRICWYVNTAEPSGYAFMSSMLQPERMFHTREQEAVLAHLLRYTGRGR